jgi:hypothetical protein
MNRRGCDFSPDNACFIPNSSVVERHSSTLALPIASVSSPQKEETVTEDTPAIKAWKESLAKKLASSKHRMREAEKQLRLLTDRIAHETSSERDDEWRREFEAAEQEFKQAFSEVWKEEEEQHRREHPEEIGEQ